MSYNIQNITFIILFMIVALIDIVPIIREKLVKEIWIYTIISFIGIALIMLYEFGFNVISPSKVIEYVVNYILGN